MDDDMANNQRQSKGNISKYLLDINKKELEKFFAVDKKTKIGLSVSALGILLFIALGVYSPFKDQLLMKLYPKEESQARISTNSGAGFLMEGPSLVKTNVEFPVMVLAKSDENLSNTFYGYFIFDKNIFEVTRIETTGTFLETVTGHLFSNANGDGLISGIAHSPGMKTYGENKLLGTIYLKAKKAGSGEIKFNDQEASIKRTSDGKSIPIFTQGLKITAQD